MLIGYKAYDSDPVNEKLKKTIWDGVGGASQRESQQAAYPGWKAAATV